MNRHSRNLAILAGLLAVLLPMTAAQAHRLHGYYRYHAYRHAIARPHVIAVAPNVYLFPYAGRLRDYPFVRISSRPPVTVPVRESESRPIGRRVPLVDRGIAVPGRTEGGPRVIPADAEITILGPDRMTIQLHRKGRGITLDR